LYNKHTAKAKYATKINVLYQFSPVFFMHSTVVIKCKHRISNFLSIRFKRKALVIWWRFL